MVADGPGTAKPEPESGKQLAPMNRPLIHDPSPPMEKGTASGRRAGDRDGQIPAKKASGCVIMA